MGSSYILSIALNVSQALLTPSLLSAISSSDENGLIFQLTFIIVWCGAAVVAVNGKLLGGKM